MEMVFLFLPPLVPWVWGLLSELWAMGGMMMVVMIREVHLPTSKRGLYHVIPHKVDGNMSESLTSLDQAMVKGVE